MSRRSAAFKEYMSMRAEERALAAERNVERDTLQRIALANQMTACREAGDKLLAEFAEICRVEGQEMMAKHWRY